MINIKVRAQGRGGSSVDVLRPIWTAFVHPPFSQIVDRRNPAPLASPTVVAWRDLMMILIQRGWILMRIFLHRRLSAAAGLGIAAMTVALAPQVAVAAPVVQSDSAAVTRHILYGTFPG